MIIKQIESINIKKSRVFIEGHKTVLLYKGEIRRLHLQEEMELSVEQYQEIMELLRKRAKQRTLHLLEKRDMTQHQLEEKLRQNEYTSEIIEDAVEYAKSYHYVDDERYARQYVGGGRKYKSRKQIEQELYRKGITQDLIDGAFEEREEDESELIRYWIQKKHICFASLTKIERQKVYQFLMRKGFRFDEIVTVFRQEEEKEKENLS